MAYVKAAMDTGQREAVLLGNDDISVLIASQGGMVSGLTHMASGTNAHWNPWFRSNSGRPYNPKQDSEFYGGKLLYHVAGNFPCVPNFGGDCIVNGKEYPAHGAAANEKWFVGHGAAGEDFACAIYTMQDGDLFYTKHDVVIDGHPVHYTVFNVYNDGNKSAKINTAWHNTVGAPFLQAGCRIDLSADKYATPPDEFEPTQMFAIGSEFDSLERVPLKKGGASDARIVPGMIGATDFIAGAIPHDAELGWGSIVNPVTGLVYVTFFLGPQAAVSRGGYSAIFQLLVDAVWWQAFHTLGKGKRTSRRDLLPWPRKCHRRFREWFTIRARASISARKPNDNRDTA